jgi:hypothetical protein
MRNSSILRLEERIAGSQRTRRLALELEVDTACNDIPHHVTRMSMQSGGLTRSQFDLFDLDALDKSTPSQRCSKQYLSSYRTRLSHRHLPHVLRSSY